METLGWVFLVLFFLTLIAFVLYIIFRPKDKSISDIKLQLEKSQNDYRKLKGKFTEEAVMRKKLEGQVLKLQLKELEDKYTYDLATMSKREKEEYEKVKNNPKEGVVFIKKLIEGNE